jgi:REP element-mobilizing transposase RayT
LFLKKEGSIAVNAFVIMPNHLHLLWQIQHGYKADKNTITVSKIYSTANEV